jgi:diguanylate cyclase (GGDEF)-like protein
MLVGPARTVIAAGDGLEALSLAAARKPDLILLDVNMPLKNGWEVLGELRRSPATSMIPVIMLTSAGTVEDKVGGLGLGADDYMTKPFDHAELQARVEGLLRRHCLALSANPLTGLPGSPAIEAEVSRRIRDKASFALFHIDIDRFKTFNDVYGFAAGDKVLLATAEVIRESVGPGFAGHIGGDDFVAVIELEDAPLSAQRLVTLFDEKIPSLYSSSDRARGWIEAADRGAQRRRVPLLTVSVGIATTKRRAFTRYAEAAQIASEMKSYLKSGAARSLSRFAFDRRRA